MQYAIETLVIELQNQESTAFNSLAGKQQQIEAFAKAKELKQALEILRKGLNPVEPEPLESNKHTERLCESCQ